ncbi:hypothetical protein ACHAQA_008142 [Verticillium albo-atrum]
MADSTPPDALINTASSLSYWQSVDADVNGMLGGFPYISRTDLQGSRAFLAKLGIGAKEGLRTVESALEGGAGIGRITEGLLLTLSEQVHVLEPIEKFTSALALLPGITVSNIGLEAWSPPPDAPPAYDLMWNQWCVGHLTDAQLVAYLRRCRAALRDGGFVVIKENLSTSGADQFDDVDGSVTRTDEKFRALFAEAGLRLVRTEIQRGFPKELFPVRIYALQ